MAQTPLKLQLMKDLSTMFDMWDVAKTGSLVPSQVAETLKVHATLSARATATPRRVLASLRGRRFKPCVRASRPSTAMLMWSRCMHGVLKSAPRPTRPTPHSSPTALQCRVRRTLATRLSGCKCAENVLRAVFPAGHAGSIASMLMRHLSSRSASCNVSQICWNTPLEIYIPAA
eukprot:5194025-Amphidinium_carterae.1